MEMYMYTIRHKRTSKYLAVDEGGAYFTENVYYLVDESTVDDYLQLNEGIYDEGTGKYLTNDELEKVKFELKEVK